MGMGCCPLAGRQFRTAGRALDEERLAIALEPLQREQFAPQYFEQWKQQALGCDCLCHVDGDHLVLC